MNPRYAFIIVGLGFLHTVFAADAPKQSTAPNAAAKSQSATQAGDKGASKDSKATPNATDKLALDPTAVTGNRELPKVLYIVPWKRADLGNLPEQSFGSLLDEALTPIDRDVFRREVDYYQVLTAKPQTAKSTADKPVSR